MSTIFVRGRDFVCAHQNDALIVVDAVTSLGGIDRKVDEWEIDAIYSGTQKCISCPAALSPVCFSGRALSVITNREQSELADIGHGVQQALQVQQRERC